MTESPEGIALPIPGAPCCGSEADFDKLVDPSKNFVVCPDCGSTLLVYWTPNQDGWSFTGMSFPGHASDAKSHPRAVYQSKEVPPVVPFDASVTVSPEPFHTANLEDSSHEFHGKIIYNNSPEEIPPFVADRKRLSHIMHRLADMALEGTDLKDVQVESMLVLDPNSPWRVCLIVPKDTMLKLIEDTAKL